MQSKEVRDKIHSKYLYDNEYFDSSYELIYYVYLKNNNIPFVYKPDPLEYYFNFFSKMLFIFIKRKCSIQRKNLFLPNFDYYR